MINFVYEHLYTLIDIIIIVYRFVYRHIYKVNELNLKILNRKIIVQGNSHFIYIPKVYFDNGQLSASEKYDIIIITKDEGQDNGKDA